MAKTNTLWLSAAVAAAVVGALLLVMLITDTKPARAAFPGPNGSIAFESDGSIWTMNPDGTGKTKLVGFNDGNGRETPPSRPTERRSPTCTAATTSQ